MKTDISQIKNDTSETRTDVATIKGILQAVK
jgi:hypothetical protein